MDISLKNNVKNSICDEVKFLRFVFIIPKIDSKLAPTINGIKLAYITNNGSPITPACLVRVNVKHLGFLRGN